MEGIIDRTALKGTMVGKPDPLGPQQRKMNTGPGQASESPRSQAVETWSRIHHQKPFEAMPESTKRHSLASLPVSLHTEVKKILKSLKKCIIMERCPLYILKWKRQVAKLHVDFAFIWC